jgi:hypothetical protein
MLLNTIIIDDFYTNPLEVREQALAMTYPKPEAGVFYPGKNSRESMLPPETDRMFSQILHEPVVGNRRMAHGRCRIALAGDPRPAVAITHLNNVDRVKAAVTKSTHGRAFSH